MRDSEGDILHHFYVDFSNFVTRTAVFLLKWKKTLLNTKETGHDCLLPQLWSSHTGDLLNYCSCEDDCVNQFLHCNGNSWTNHKCEYARSVEYNLVVSDKFAQ